MEEIDIELLKKEAEQGNAESQYSLGYCYFCGNEVEQNYEKAVELWEKSSNQNYVAAQVNLGVAYYFGLGTSQDYEKAVELWTKAANQGDSDALVKLAGCYSEGTGVEPDLSKSLERIKMLDHMGVEVLLREIHNNVIDLNTSLDHEKECKKEYDSKCENLYYISDCTIRNFDHIKKEIETVLKDFATTEEITLFLSKCDEFKVQLKKDKQIMDNNIYGHQPYSVRLENMNKLNETIEAFQSHLDSFANVAKNLENDKNECIGKINGYINYLRQSQIILDNCNLPALVKRYKEKVNNIEELISKLFISLRKPYKVKVAKDVCNILDVECKDLYGKVRYSQRLMVFVEKIIVIAARYRDKFQEVDYAVNRASFYFLEGDFEASRNIVEKLSTYGIVFPKFSEIEA